VLTITGVFIFLITVFGIVNVFVPYVGWYLSIGWKIKDAEPSDLALGMQRLGGGIVAAIGIVVMISGIIGWSQEKNWPDSFKDKVQNVRIADIQMGNQHFTKDEIEQVTKLIQEAPIYKAGEQESVFGYHAEVDITFTDGTEEAIYMQNGQMDIRPLRLDVYYTLQSDSLRELLLQKEGSN